MVSEPVSEKIWYCQKVSEPVSVKFGVGKSLETFGKFGTEKSTGIGIGNIWYRNKVSVSVSFKILGTVTHCSERYTGKEITLTIIESDEMFGLGLFSGNVDNHTLRSSIMSCCFDWLIKKPNRYIWDGARRWAQWVGKKDWQLVFDMSPFLLKKVISLLLTCVYTMFSSDCWWGGREVVVFSSSWINLMQHNL